MNSSLAIKHITIQDYLELEEVAPEKHEYYNGEVFAMAGASIAHNQIVSNSIIAIGSFLQEKKCRIFPSDLRIHVEANSLFTYPDLTIFCDKINRFENRVDTALNPTVIIEVLSKSTQEYDRGTKFNLYRQIQSLQEYIMVSSTEILIEKYVKQSGSEWLFTTKSEESHYLQIESIGFSTEVKNLYRNVDFEEETKS